MWRVDAARTFWINDDSLLRLHVKNKHPRDGRRNRGGRPLEPFSKWLPTSLMTEHWAATSASFDHLADAARAHANAVIE